MAGSIADLFANIRANLDTFDKDLKAGLPKSADKAATTFGGKMKAALSGGSFGQFVKTGFGLGAGLGIFHAVTDAIGGVTDVLGGAIDAASNMNETQSKLDQVFTDSAETVRKWSEGSARSMGLSQQAALEAAGTFGNFLQAMGQAEPEAARMSTSLVQLASDLGSFNNEDPTEVLDALRSGLSGETEPLRRFGVDISDAAVQAELLKEGVQKTAGAFTQAQKIQGRYNLILRQTTKAQGDYARTATGLANGQRTLSAELEDAMTKLGQILLPVAVGLTNLAVQIIPTITDAIGNLGDAFNNLNRFLNPNLAFLQDQLDIVPEIAKAMGLGADQLQAYIEAQAKLTEITKAQEQADKDLQDALTQQLINGTLSLQSIDAQAASLSALTGRREEDIKSILEATSVTLDQRDAILALPRAIVPATAAEDDHARAIAATTQAAKDLIASQKQARGVLGLYGMATLEVTADTKELGKVIDVTAEATAKAAGEVFDLSSALDSTVSGFKDLRKEMRDTDKTWRALVRGPDLQRKSIHQLQHQVDVWGARYEYWLSRGRLDLAAFAAAQGRQAQEELNSRKAVREELANQKAAVDRLTERYQTQTKVVSDGLGDVTVAIKRIPRRTFTDIVLQGGAAVESRLEGIIEATKIVQGLYGSGGIDLQMAAIETQRQHKGGKGGKGGKRAMGGPVEAGMLYEVNEGRRREYFRPRVDGTVIPLGPGSGPTVNLQVYGQPMRAETPREVVAQLNRAARLGILEPTRRTPAWSRS